MVSILVPRLDLSVNDALVMNSPEIDVKAIKVTMSASSSAPLKRSKFSTS